MLCGSSSDYHEHRGINRAIAVGSGVIAYGCVAMCVAGLLLLLIDVLRSQQDPICGHVHGR